MSNCLNFNVILVALVDYCKNNNINLPKVVIVKSYSNGALKIIFNNNRFVVEDNIIPEGLVKVTILSTGL